MATKIDIVAGDKGYVLTFTLQNSDGTPFVITGASLLLKVQKQDAATLAFSGVMVVSSGTGGVATYTVVNGNFDTSGKYYAEIEVTNGGLTVTFTDIVIDVKPQLARNV